MLKATNPTILICFSLLFLSQITTIASTQASDDSTKAELLQKQAFGFLVKQDLDSLFLKSKEFLNFSKNNTLAFHEATANRYLGSYFLSTGNNDSAIYYFKNALPLYLKQDSTNHYGMVLTRIGAVYRQMEQVDTAISYYNKALNYLTINNNPQWYGIARDHLGLIYMKLADYYLALNNMQEAFIAFEKIDQKTSMANEYINMGIVYKNTNNSEKATEAYLNAIDILIKIDTIHLLGSAYNNLASMYIDKGNLEEALELLGKAKTIYEVTDYKYGMPGYYSTLSSYYTNLNPPNYYKVIESSSKGMSIAIELKDFRQYAHATNVLGDAYIKTNKINKAESILKEGLSISTEYNFKGISALITKLLSEVYEKKNQPILALKYLSEYVSLNDSLLNEDKVRELTILELSFNFKQERIIDSLNNLKREQNINFLHQQEIQEQKIVKVYYLAFSLILIIVVIFVLIYFRKSKKQEKILYTKNLQIEKSLIEKEVLLKEVHHRVRNNFQTVSSLLELQSVDVNDKKAIVRIREGQNRINAMALIHQNLYQSEDIDKVNLQEYINLLAQQIAALYTSIHVETIINANDINLDIDTAVPLGLIINELITNSFKYAFSDKQKNMLTIDIDSTLNKNYTLTFSDNGSGLPEKFENIKSNTLGLKLIRLLARQLHGNFQYKYNNGSIFVVTFKNEAQRKSTE